MVRYLPDMSKEHRGRYRFQSLRHLSTQPNWWRESLYLWCWYVQVKNLSCLLQSMSMTTEIGRSKITTRRPYVNIVPGWVISSFRSGPIYVCFKANLIGRIIAVLACSERWRGYGLPKWYYPACVAEIKKRKPTVYIDLPFDLLSIAIDQTSDKPNSLYRRDANNSDSKDLRKHVWNEAKLTWLLNRTPTKAHVYISIIENFLKLGRLSLIPLFYPLIPYWNFSLGW